MSVKDKMSASTIADHMEPRIPVNQESSLVRISPLRWVYGSRTPAVSRFHTDFHLGGNALISDILKLVASNLDSAGLEQMQAASSGMWEICAHEKHFRVYTAESEDTPHIAGDGWDERYECDDGYDRWDELYNDDHLEDWQRDDDY